MTPKEVANKLKELRVSKNFSTRKYSIVFEVPEEYVLFVESGSDDLTVDDVAWYAQNLGFKTEIKFTEEDSDE